MGIRFKKMFSLKASVNSSPILPSYIQDFALELASVVHEECCMHSVHKDKTKIQHNEISKHDDKMKMLKQFYSNILITEKDMFYLLD